MPHVSETARDEAQRRRPLDDKAPNPEITDRNISG